MSIGNRVRQARKAAGMTQQQLAKKAGIKQPTLSELETGESASSTLLPSIAAATGVSAYWLETGKGEMRSGAALSVVHVGASDQQGLPLGSGLQWISPQEYQLLSLFRGTDDRGRETMLEHGETMPKVSVSGLAVHKP